MTAWAASMRVEHLFCQSAMGTVVGTGLTGEFSSRQPVNIP